MTTSDHDLDPVDAARALDVAEEAADNKPPALAAMAILEIMEELADKEVLLSQKIAMRAFIAKVREDESVKIILDVEREVGQEVFKFGVKMTKVMAGQSLQELVDRRDPEGRPMSFGIDDMTGAIDGIRLANPYAGDAT